MNAPPGSPRDTAQAGGAVDPVRFEVTPRTSSNKNNNSSNNSSSGTTGRNSNDVVAVWGDTPGRTSAFATGVGSNNNGGSINGGGGGAFPAVTPATTASVSAVALSARSPGPVLSLQQQLNSEHYGPQQAHQTQRPGQQGQGTSGLVLPPIVGTQAYAQARAQVHGHSSYSTTTAGNSNASNSYSGGGVAGTNTTNSALSRPSSARGASNNTGVGGIVSGPVMSRPGTARSQALREAALLAAAEEEAGVGAPLPQAGFVETLTAGVVELISARRRTTNNNNSNNSNNNNIGSNYNAAPVSARGSGQATPGFPLFAPNAVAAPANNRATAATTTNVANNTSGVHPPRRPDSALAMTPTGTPRGVAGGNSNNNASAHLGHLRGGYPITNLTETPPAPAGLLNSKRRTTAGSATTAAVTATAPGPVPALGLASVHDNAGSGGGNSNNNGGVDGVVGGGHMSVRGSARASARFTPAMADDLEAGLPSFRNKTATNAVMAHGNESDSTAAVAAGNARNGDESARGGVNASATSNAHAHAVLATQTPRGRATPLPGQIDDEDV